MKHTGNFGCSFGCDERFMKLEEEFRALEVRYQGLEAQQEAASSAGREINHNLQQFSAVISSLRQEIRGSQLAQSESMVAESQAGFDYSQVFPGVQTHNQPQSYEYF